MDDDEASVNRLTASLLRIATDAGPQDILAVIPPDGVPDRGIADYAILGAFEKLVDAGGPLPHERFAQNPAFLRVLHGVIREHAPTSPDLRQEAERLGDGSWASSRCVAVRWSRLPIPPRPTIACSPPMASSSSTSTSDRSC
jgi:hypothetical protein